MKLTICIFVLLCIQLVLSFKEETVDYVLNTIEYLANEYSGVFSCVFIDISQGPPYNNILNEVLTSPRLTYIVKYVLNGTFHDALEDQMPRLPSLLLIYPGDEVGHLRRVETIRNVTFTMALLNPATKVLVLVNSNRGVGLEMEQTIYVIRFADSVILYCNTMLATLCNGVYCSGLIRAPHPMYLFTLLRRRLTGRKLTYIVNESVVPFYWNHKWINETARYLQTEAVEYQSECSKLDKDFEQCMEKYRFNFDVADILFARMMSSSSRNYQELYTGIPWFTKIVVPRERAYNAIELILMPFTWNAWTLLLLVLASAEISKRLFPKLFKNDPILLVVCGFERRSLYRAGRLERITFQSLIILMFFMSSAFETKIVSLMVSKPSLRRIKTLEDVVNSNIKFYADLEKIPDLRQNPVVGKLLIQGQSQKLYESVPGAAYIMQRDWIVMLDEMSFDYERMQPFYTALEGEFFGGNEMYMMKFRSTFLEAFRYMHNLLVENGLMDLWKRQWMDRQIDHYAGRRIKLKIKDKIDLNFGDMQPAWMALMIGLAAGLVAFVGELVRKRFEECLQLKTKKNKF